LVRKKHRNWTIKKKKKVSEEKTTLKKKKKVSEEKATHWCPGLPPAAPQGMGWFPKPTNYGSETLFFRPTELVDVLGTPQYSSAGLLQKINANNPQQQ